MNLDSTPVTKAPWLLQAYLVLCFHQFGAVLMLHFFNYLGFRMIPENVRPVFEIFNRRMVPFVYVPAGLLAVAALALGRQAPAGLSKRLVLLSLAADAWVFFITATYFVPKIQLPLDKGFSLPLIEEFLRNNFPIRGSVIVAMYFVTAWLFLKVAPGSSSAAARDGELPAPALS